MCFDVSSGTEWFRRRSHESIIEEAKQMIEEPDFKGYIHDVGGPTARFSSVQPVTNRLNNRVYVPNRQCLFPKPCQNLKADHMMIILNFLRKLEETCRSEESIYSLRNSI